MKTKEAPTHSRICSTRPSSKLPAGFTRYQARLGGGKRQEFVSPIPQTSRPLHLIVLRAGLSGRHQAGDFCEGKSKFGCAHSTADPIFHMHSTYTASSSSGWWEPKCQASGRKIKLHQVQGVTARLSPRSVPGVAPGTAWTTATHLKQFLGLLFGGWRGGFSVGT